VAPQICEQILAFHVEVWLQALLCDKWAQKYVALYEIGLILCLVSNACTRLETAGGRSKEGRVKENLVAVM